MGATTGVFSLFQMGFYFVTTGWIFLIGLCENSINQSINVSLTTIISSTILFVYDGWGQACAYDPPKG